MSCSIHHQRRPLHFTADIFSRYFYISLLITTGLVLGLVQPAVAAPDSTPEPTLWADSSTTKEHAYLHYEELFTNLGLPVGDKPMLLGIRGLKLGKTEPHEVKSHSFRYDDAFIFLVPEDNAAYTFAGSTHPFQRRSDESPDIDEDGDGDVAMIRPGFYHVERMDPERLLVRNTDGTARIPAYRDFNHNGLFEPEEKARALEITRGRYATPEMGLFATAILFHAGKGFGSIGCQTAPARHIALLHDHAPFDYMLMEAENVLAMATPEPPEEVKGPLMGAPMAPVPFATEVRVDGQGNVAP